MKLYRALVRVTSMEVDPGTGGYFRVFVPASLCKETVRIPVSQFPASMQLQAGSRLFARVTLDATVPGEMLIEGPYEAGLLPDSNDGLA